MLKEVDHELDFAANSKDASTNHLDFISKTGNNDSEKVLDELIKDLNLFTPDSSSKFSEDGLNLPSKNRENQSGYMKSKENSTQSKEKFYTKKKLQGKKVDDFEIESIFENVGDEKNIKTKVESPQIDQFDSFEQYLNALVSFEKSSNSEQLTASIQNENKSKGGKYWSFVTEEIQDKPQIDNELPPIPNIKDSNNDLQLNSLSVKELKEKLKAKGLLQSGKKAELIERLTLSL
jgi:hypothetical protein